MDESNRNASIHPHISLTHCENVENWNTPRSRQTVYQPSTDLHAICHPHNAAYQHAAAAGGEQVASRDGGAACGVAVHHYQQSSYAKHPQQQQQSAIACRTSTAGQGDASSIEITATTSCLERVRAIVQQQQRQPSYYSQLNLSLQSLANRQHQPLFFREEEEEQLEEDKTESDIEADCKMPRPSLKKPETPKMAERPRRSTTYQRPKSQADMSSASARLENRLRGDGGASSDEDLARQNTDLRQRLRDEASLYRKRLDTYRQAQQNQATLVSRLQAKVLQYKQRCADLEAQIGTGPPDSLNTSLNVSGRALAAPGSALEQAQQHLRDIREVRDDHITELDVALAKLDEERKKCDKLMAHNKILREQLEESQQTNEDLTEDLQKLTNQFEELREEMLIKEDEWKDEEQAFNDYYSTEHNRLLNLWRDVVSIKRLFMDVQTSTERDLNKLRTDIQTSVRDVNYNCDKIDRGVRSESMLSLAEPRTHFNLENVELKSQLDLLRAQFDAQKSDLRVKDDRIQELKKDIQLLEDRCSDAEQSVVQVAHMQDEVDLLQNALRDIAHALIQDAEAKDIAGNTHVHLSSSTPVPQKSPKQHSRISSNAFAESTISAVQAALHKHKSVKHELQVKLQSTREQFHLVRKQLEASEMQSNELGNRLREVIQQLDLCKNQCSQSTQENDNLQKLNDVLRNEKNAIEKQKYELSKVMENLNQDLDKMQNKNLKLQKEVDALLDEKLYFQNEVDRLMQEGSLREMNLRSEEDRCSRIREELLTTREELNKLYLSHDVLIQQKNEVDTLVKHLEKVRSDLEHELERVGNERAKLHEGLVKKEGMAGHLETEKRKLLDSIKKLEEEKQQLQSQVNDQGSDIQSLRKELLQAEQAKLDLDSDRVTLTEKVKFLEIEKGKIEMELSHVTRDRTDLCNQLTALTRKKDAVVEELTRTKHKLDQQTETNTRINRNLEELVTESEEKQCALDSLEKDLQRAQEHLAVLRSEKESLEAVLFDTQTNLEATEIKRDQLENDNQELNVKVESLKGQVQRLSKDIERSEKRFQEVKQSLTSQAGAQEVEFQHILSNLKAQNEDTIKQLTEEREFIRSSLEKKLQNTIQQLTNEKETEVNNLVERIEALQGQTENLILQHEELMLRAENDKQQALLLAHHDQQALQERLEETKRHLQEEREALERCKRENNVTFEQNRNLMNQTKEELTKNKAKLIEMKQKYEEEKLKLESAIGDLQRDKEGNLGDIQNMKVQIHLYEDKVDSLNNQLHDTLRKLKEMENISESLRKDLTDVRRQYSDCNFEKEKYHSSNKELRDLVKKLEFEKREQARQIEENYQKLSVADDAKNALEVEKGKLQNIIRETEKEQIQLDNKLQSLVEELQRKDSQNNQAQAEEKELQARLLNEVEERDRAHQEVHNVKKQLAELDRNLEQTRKELAISRAHQGHLEEQWHAKEQDLLVHLEDCRAREKRLEDQKHNLEVCLVDASQQIQELKTKLSSGESRMRSLDAQLAQTETQKRDVEQKLTSVISTLRRIAGIQLDGTITAQSQRLMSPSRRWSPARVNDYEKIDSVSDIDPESVRKGVRNLMQQVAVVERERDDLKSQVAMAKKQLKESTDNQAKGDNKLGKMLQNFRLLQDEKGALEAKLGQKVIAYNTQADALMKKSEEAQQLRDKVTNLEVTLATCSEDKKQLEDKIDKMKTNLHKLENDKRNLQEELSRCDARGSKMELQRMSAEGDLHRLQMMLQERDASIHKQQEKIELQARSLASLEERCSSLKSTIDQLNQSLEKAANSESEMKIEIQSLQRSLLESNTQGHSGQERLKTLQKTLNTCENDKKILAERYDSSQQNAAELRRNNQLLQDQIARLNNELANCEVQRSGLESQLRVNQWPVDSSVGSHHEEELLRQLQSVQRERNDLRTKVESLNTKMRQIESENQHLERAMSRTPHRSKSYERQDKYELDTSMSDRQSMKLEQENRELRMQISKLESELSVKESELARLKIIGASSSGTDMKYLSTDIERYRAAQLQAERLLEAREQSHRQQVQRLENQVANLREQLNQEIKRRQQYVMRSSRAGREMQQLRQALGDSLRTVSQDPSLDALLLEQEARKLDHTASTTASLPPGLSYDRKDRSTPQPPPY